MILYPICFLSPLLVLWLTCKSKILNKIGSVVLAYALGCLLGLSGLLPQDAATAKAQETIANIAIPVAIPLMLFSSDVKAWLRLAPNFAKSLLAGVAATVIAVAAGFFLFGTGHGEQYAGMGGLLMGLYTGGTANLASLKLVLGIDNETYLMVHTYSILVGAIYLLVLIFCGRQVAGLVLPRFDARAASDGQPAPDVETASHDDELFLGLFSRGNLGNLLRGLGCALAVVAVGGAIAMLAPSGSFLAVFILSMSVLAIGASFVRRIRRIERTFEMGIYFILVFSVAVSSQVSVSMFRNIDLTFFYYILFVTLGALAIHIVLNALMRVDTDTTLVSSISLICSPPFVPVMAGALNNRAVIGPGIAVGLIGYAVGTYLGYAVAMALASAY